MSIIESEDNRPVQWDLISPWSEGDEIELSSPEFAEATAFFQQDTPDEDDTSSVTSSSVVEPESEARMEERLRELVESEMALALEAKLSREANGTGADDKDIITRDIDMDEDDEEFEVYNVSMLVREIDSVEELFEEKLDSTATDEDENEDYTTDGTRTSVATTMDDSCEESPRASSLATKSSRWGRIKAQSYNGSATVSSVQSAYAKIRSRTLSTASSFRNSSQSYTGSEMEDDGDFSSDDEGYSKDRVSRMGGASSGRRTFVSHLSSVGSLKVPTKMGFLRFRSSSATTTTSEDSSFPISPQGSVRGEAQSEPSFSTIEDRSASLPHYQQSNNHRMQALKLKASVCASQAAGYLNAASAEAARKIKSKTFRGAAAAAKPTASETEEEAEPPSLCLAQEATA